MKKVVIAGLVLLTAAAASTPAYAVSSRNNELASQITTLQKQVRTLQKQVKVLQKTQKQTRDIALGAFQFGICVGAITADAFRGTWAVVDQVAQATQSRTYFGPQPTVNDQNVCAANNVPRSQAVPPTMSAFSALYALLGSSMSY